MVSNKDELVNSLLVSSVYDRYYKEDKITIQNLFGVELVGTIAFNQNNPHHCYDLYGHLLKTVDYLKDLIDINSSEDRLLLVAALYHDVGKIDVSKLKDGKNVFYGHADRSVEKISDFLDVVEFEEVESTMIKFYIKHHDDFISWKHIDEDVTDNNRSHRNICLKEFEKYLNKVIEQYNGAVWIRKRELWHRLMKLCYADVQAQSDIVIWKGKVVNSKAQKIKRITAIQEIIKNALLE